ncbi:PEP-CTERM-box response regulator transcription factor [Sphingobium sufflavum]|uniref:PEP-CTERM-box response regulator transcription factor n=1 Tax=Sphingobium sufflavum TaxID=1129547 RepID=UPI001F2E9711|nr:PEP-CTERM-box response regulator transcription factor [Sphingobium sufflavum]MCE7794989.1 PEP-CTERM-box response regulator transcription factor [Sphingobium sufflavum]
MADSRPKLLIVEDDAGLQRQLRWSYDEYQIFMAGDREEAIAILRAESPHVVTLDLGLPPDPDGVTEGFATLAEILRIAPDTKVVIASGHGERESARRSIAEGAWDFYQKPIDLDSLRHIVARAFHVHRLEAENVRLADRAPEDRRVLGGLVTGAPEMMAVARMVERVAPAEVAVMLLGASGTGKELIARAVHDASPRGGGPFVAINCAAIPETLLESELFGHEKGAFTGAIRTTPGKIEGANGGTLFLDEVGDIPLPLQVKLLRFLQERTVERLGGREAIRVDTRIVCATHQDVDAMMADGRFRDDLYYRLAEMVIRIPTLAQRPGDPMLLARHFLKRHAAAMNPAVTGFAPDAVAAIDSWTWPGNVRELENRVKRAVIMAEGKMVAARDLDLPGGEGDADGAIVNLKAARERADRQAIRHALSRADGNISGAAKLLGVSRPTLYDLMKSYDLSA